ncbi:MAG: SDR family oxidoreductase [Spirochaetales bacterium]|nr:SDR family oxidoreductase [Spirochaetales bacterium]
MKKILIYGGSGGIGRRVGEILVAQGVRVHVAGRNREALEETAEALEASYTVGDAQDPAFFAQAAAEAGDIDGLVYAIGTINLKSLARFTPEEIDRDFQVNARGAALAVAASLQSLKSNEGSSVVLFSSVAAVQGFTNHVSVSLAKGAVSGLTLALAAELAPKVRVNALAPSLIRTPLAAALLSNAQLETAIAGMHGLPRLGTPDDVAQAAVFLLSEHSSWVTGQIWGIDGGRSSLRIKA